MRHPWRAVHHRTVEDIFLLKPLVTVNILYFCWTWYFSILGVHVIIQNAWPWTIFGKRATYNFRLYRTIHTFSIGSQYSLSRFCTIYILLNFFSSWFMVRHSVLLHEHPPSKRSPLFPHGTRRPAQWKKCVNKKRQFICVIF
jgi:hypothetical protein